MDSKPIVALVESVWDGHHPTYYRAFARCLLELGYRVVAVCPEPEQLVDDLRPDSFSKKELHVIAWSPPQVNIRPRRFQHPINTRLGFAWLKKKLSEFERQTNQSVQFVFFACLYEPVLRLLPRDFPWPWGGLYLQIRAFRMPGTPLPDTGAMFSPAALLGSKKHLKGLAVLDEGAVEFMQRESGQSNVVRFPDLTDESAPEFKEVALQLKEFAQGRPIVGIAGHLKPTKGLITFVRLAAEIDDENVVFACIGSMLSGLFGEAQLKEIDSFSKRPNVFCHWDKIPDGPVFNGILQQFSVIFAAYHDFPHSSNILTKAALVGRPVIVSDGYLMAERVRAFGLGAVVPENDPAASAYVIRGLLNQKQGSTSNEGRQQYLERHSQRYLLGAMKQLLIGALQERGRTKHTV